MTDMTRRKLLSAAGIAAGAAVFNPLVGVSELSAQEALVRSTHFGGPYQALNDIVGKRFAQAGLGRVEYDVEVSPSVIAKLQTQRGNPPFDVAMVSRSFGLRALNAGLLEKVSAADFPEAKALIPQAIPAAGWGVAMISDTFDMMIDTNQVKEPVTSWLDLWKPEFKGKMALPSAANGGATFAFISCIVRAVGGQYQSDATVNDAFARLKALKPSVRTFYPDSIQPTQLIDRGDISIAPQFGIRIANQTKVSPNIVKTMPKEGIAAIPYDLCITRGSKNVELAKKYINLTLTKPVQEQLVAALYGTPCRTDLTLAPELKKLVSLDPSQLFFQDEEYAASKQREWLDRYTREVQS
jgi:putative spermidine/putrescine transport system substrate-binding protein